jgi:hypothetical protein
MMAAEREVLTEAFSAFRVTKVEVVEERGTKEGKVVFHAALGTRPERH